MMELLKAVFGNETFMPHGHCYVWEPGLLKLMTVSDVLIAVAYYSIPLTLILFVCRRKDLPFPWIFVLFGVFIIACGTTHLMSILMTWIPLYWLEGWVKAATAAVSVVTAVLLIPLVPKALALRGPKELEALNQQMKTEIQERRNAEQRLTQQAEVLTQANAELEQFNSVAIGREHQMVELKRRINELSQALGRPAPYDLSFARAEPRDGLNE